MKLSVSLSNEDIEFLDAYARAQGIPSRSAALHRAIRALRTEELGVAYEEAFAEWDDDSGAAADWDTTVADGLGPDAEG
jgi:hypothetical protein